MRAGPTQWVWRALAVAPGLLLLLDGATARGLDDEAARPGGWAFQRLLRPEVPKVRSAQWIRNPIDAFILARLEQAGLSPSPEADRRTLIRRLSLDVLGLPPSPESVVAFQADSRPDAYERLVEEMLASPHYAEQWARHWLDVVRFAETHGFETNTPRPNAWPYRDYVIRSFDQDKPYDAFIREQIAGDQLGEHAATGFLVAGPWDEVKSPDVELTASQRDAELHDMVSTTASTFLGLTVGCAKCHDHKFDPISQLDYFAMRACLEGVQHGEQEITPEDWEQRLAQASELEPRIAALDREIDCLEPLASGTPASRPPVQHLRNVERFTAVDAKLVRFTVLATTGAEPCIDELEIYGEGLWNRNLALAANGAVARASSEFPASDIHRIEHLNDGRTGNSRSWISNEPGAGYAEIVLPAAVRIDKIVWGRDREGVFKDRLATQYRIEVALDSSSGWRVVASSEDRRPAGGEEVMTAPERLHLQQERDDLATRHAHLMRRPRIYAGTFDREPAPTHLLYRGNPMDPREQVVPGVPGAFGIPFPSTDPTDEPRRRLALADWLTHKDQSQTSRVIVNRLWQHHFGTGIVDTPSDFGRNGGKPTHPEMLDALAAELVAHKWSLKSIHRLILNSAAYRQSSAPRPEAARVDAGARLLWRYPPRRLEAEALRDAILAVSGVLDLRMGGPGFDLFEPNGNYVKVYTPKAKFGPAEFRRMIYQAKPRMELDGVFGAFDCPDAGQIAPRRTISTTALQALNLLNSPFMVEQSSLFAARVERDPAPIARAFLLAFGRPPVAEEAAASERLVRDHGLAALCRALFNANEFITVK